MSKTVPELMNLLFSTFPPRQPEQGVDPVAHIRAQLEAYERALDGMDVRDVDAAVTKFLQGRVGGHNPSFLPSAAFVGTVVRECMNERLDSERRRSMRNPRLPPPAAVKTPESIAKFKAMLAEVDRNLAAMSLNEDAERERIRQDLQRKTDERFAPDMSPEAQRQRLGKRPHYSVGDPDGEAA